MWCIDAYVCTCIIISNTKWINIEIKKINSKVRYLLYTVNKLFGLESIVSHPRLNERYRKQNHFEDIESV